MPPFFLHLPRSNWHSAAVYIWAGIKSSVSPGFPGSCAFKCPITLVQSLLFCALSYSTCFNDLYIPTISVFIRIVWVVSHWNTSHTSFTYGLIHLGRVTPRLAQALKSCRVRVLQIGSETHLTRDLSLFLSVFLVLASFCSKVLFMW